MHEECVAQARGLSGRRSRFYGCSNHEVRNSLISFVIALEVQVRCRVRQQGRAVMLVGCSGSGVKWVNMHGRPGSYELAEAPL